MAKKVVGYIKLQLPAGKATPQPPVGPALGQYSVAIPVFTKDFNERTADKAGLIIPVVVTIYADRSFTFVLKTPPAAVLIKKACGIESGSANSIKTKVAKITKAQVKEIAELNTKMRTHIGTGILKGNQTVQNPIQSCNRRGIILLTHQIDNRCIDLP